jgi:ABC-2 type transport system ATP-binding protein
MTYAIETIGLKKRFTASQGFRDLLPRRRRRYVEVLRGIDLRIPQGEIFGILGPNGAGKTTLLKILGTLILPTEGQALVMGINVAEEPETIKDFLTYAVSEERSLNWRLTGQQNLQYFAAINNIPQREARGRIANLLDLLDLGSAADRRVMYYSTGMRQKLILARTLLADPDILLLDEAARSIDPLMAISLWRFVREELVNRRGKTVVMATHNLEEARRVCDRVSVLYQGKIQACGTVEELSGVESGQHRYTLTLHPSANGVHHVLENAPGVIKVREIPSEEADRVSYEILVTEPEVYIPAILERVMAARGKVLACAPHQQSLRDVLVALTEENSNSD